MIKTKEMLIQALKEYEKYFTQVVRDKKFDENTLFDGHTTFDKDEASFGIIMDYYRKNCSDNLRQIRENRFDIEYITISRIRRLLEREEALSLSELSDLQDLLNYTSKELKDTFSFVPLTPVHEILSAKTLSLEKASLITDNLSYLRRVS